MPETDSPTPDSVTFGTGDVSRVAEDRHPYYFTFGSDHLSGRGFRRYVVVYASTSTEARQRVYEKYGTGWAFQYIDPESAGIKQHDMIEVDFRTGEDRLTLDLLQRAALVMRTLGSTPEVMSGWLADYERWLATR